MGACHLISELPYRVYEVDPMLGRFCGSEMRIAAFIFILLAG